MTWLADLPFQRKVRFAIVLTTTVSMALACGVFFAFEFIGYRRSLERTVATLSRITAENSTAAIAFADPERARQTLESLRAEPQIVAAALCGTDGRVIASYTAEPDFAVPEARSQTAGVIRIDGRVLCVESVVEGSRRLGTLYVWASMDQLYARMGLYGIVVLIVFGATLVFTWVLSSILRRTIARPILELAHTTGAITSAQDFSLRARQYGSDELGRLTADFNTMLERTESAVAALRASEAQLRIVTDNASVYLAHCDWDGRFKFINRPYAERFGLDVQQVIGRRIEDVVGPVVATALRPYVEAALRGERVEFENELDYPSVGPRWMHVVYVPERGPGGGVAGFVAIITDITRRKLVEHDVARARDEALAASRAKDGFLAALSHELRTPLNPVLLLASEAARDPRLPAEVREDFETIRKHVDLEARLIDDLLDLTSITRGKVSLDHKRVDVHAVLRDALATVASDVELKNISLTLQAGATRPEVLGDGVRLQQVFWNVLKNAVKFTPERGRISVETATVGSVVTVHITDSGIGLTEPEIARIFDAFSQGDHAGVGGSHRFGGLGLGLTISRMLVELHLGKISATSPGRGRGSSFTIELPLTSGPGPLDGAPSNVAGKGVAPGPAPVPLQGGSGPRRILLVEDHAATRDALERLLVRRHFLVSSAGSLAEARALTQAKTFDLLISDVGLPDGSGYELMQEVRSSLCLKGIALTGYGMEGDLVRSQQAGFSAHLTKPVRVQELDAALAKVLGE